MSRRDFLKRSIAVVTAVVVPNISDARTSTKNDINNTLSSSLEALNKSIVALGEQEVDYFANYFKLGLAERNPEAFKNTVIQFQSKNNLKPDGIFGLQTLEMMYIKEYGPNISRQPEWIQRRWEVYQEMSDKNYKRGAIRRPGLHKFNIFKKETYLGLGGGKPGIEEKKFINNELYRALESSQELQSSGNYIKIKKVNGKQALLFYKEGQLYIASYISAGSRGRTPRRVYKAGRTDKYHTSSKYPKPRGGAVMPYAVHVTGGIRLHGSDGKIDGVPRSHGCIRIPLYYQKEVFDQVSQIGKDNISIDTLNVYK